MIAWAEQKRLPNGVLDPSSASLLPQTTTSAQPFFVDTATLADAVRGFTDILAESPEEATSGIFNLLAKSVSGNIETYSGFVQPVIDKDRTGSVKALIGPDIDARVIHKRDAVRSAFQKLAEDSPFRSPPKTAQKSVKQPEAKSSSAAQAFAPVAMGVADFSIAFLNRRFRKADGSTRFEMLWIQDREPLDAYKPLFPTYQLFGLGTFLMRHDIDVLIGEFTTNGVLDEDAAYAAFTKPPLGMRDSWALRDGHGTAILDQMAGADPGTHDEDRPIYGVELPTSVLVDTSGQKLLAPLLLGLTAISVTSLFFTPSVTNQGWGIHGAPLVINASLAFTGGPDNGADKSGFATLLSALMGALQTLPHDSLTLTIPAGNHQQDRLHARLRGGAAQSVSWGLPPDDYTPSTLEIYVEGGADLEELALTRTGESPITLNAAALPQVGYYTDLVSQGEIIGRLSHQQGFGPKHYALTMAPTARRDTSQPIAPSGTWVVSVTSCSADIALWVRRDDRLPGFAASGRQSWLIDGAYMVFDQGTGDIQTSDQPRSGAPSLKVYREGAGSVLLDAMNGGANGIVGVAGLQSDGAQPYRFGGSRRAGGAQTPTTAVAEVSRWRGGPLAAARISGGVSRPAGTSIACAIHAREVADAL